jgi:hypothetical protein
VSAEQTVTTWKVGDTALDLKRGQVGTIQQIDRYISGRRAWLRPRHGGAEWTASIRDLRPVDSGEAAP